MHRRILKLGHRRVTNFRLFDSNPLLPAIQPILSTPKLNEFMLFRSVTFIASTPELGPDTDDPYSLLTEDPITTCSRMWIENFREPQKEIINLTSLLRRFELWVLAYQKVAIDFTGKYIPRSEISKPALQRLLALRDAVLDSRFKWGARLQFFIVAPNDKTNYELLTREKVHILMNTTQPTPFQDRIVQEVLLMILEPVFEPRFSSKSFAFRPGRTAHTVLRVIRRNYAGYLWYIKGNLTPILNRMKVGVVINALKKLITDQKIIDLIRAALVTPVITGKVMQTQRRGRLKSGKRWKGTPPDQPKPDPYWLTLFYKFAPREASYKPSWGHCGILTPFLANICLDELDHWMEHKIQEFYSPSKSDIILNTFGGAAPQGTTFWPEFIPTSAPDKTRKMDYVRCGAHILIGIRGTMLDASTLRKQIIQFCDQKYHLMPDLRKLPIKHITRGLYFLDHILHRKVVYPNLRYTAAGGRIVSETGVGTLLSVRASLQLCVRHFKKVGLLSKYSVDPMPLPCFKMYHATQAHTNLAMNKFLCTISEWYKYADNRKKVVSFCSFVVKSSLAKLYTTRYKMRTRARVYKVAAPDLSRPIRVKDGLSIEYKDLRTSNLAETVDGIRFMRPEQVPTTDYTPFPGNWRPDHEKMLCEYIMLRDPRTLERQRCELRQEHGLVTPQDFISMLVWDYKRSAPTKDGPVSLDKNNKMEEGEDVIDEREGCGIDEREGCNGEVEEV